MEKSKCPECGSTRLSGFYYDNRISLICMECGYEWERRRGKSAD